MKRILYFLLTAITVSIFSLSSASAQFRPNSTVCDYARSNNSAAANSSVCTQNATSADPIFGPSGIITIVVRIMTYLVAVASVFTIVIGGFMYITSGGDPQRTNQAKDTILFAIVGIAIAAVAQVIVLFVLDKLSS